MGNTAKTWAAGRQLVILAGGKGTRLGDRLGDNPKPMVPVAGKPLLEYHLELARRHGIEEVVLLSGFRSQSIVDHFGDGGNFGVRIRHVVEAQPLGTAGALIGALDELDDEFTVLYGDTMLDVELDRMWAAHRRSGAEATLFVHPNDHPADSDLVETDSNGRVLQLHGYPHAPGAPLQNLVNAALYVLDKRCLRDPALVGRKFDIAKHLFPELLAKGVHLHAYKSREYIKDMGTPARLDRVEADVLAGRVAARRASAACPACFLDRDGTINREVTHLRRTDQMELLPGVGPSIRRLNRAGWLVPVVTNQPVVARGDCSESELRQIHNRMESLLGAEGAYVDEVYYCPHHPDAGFPGERVELKVSCSCRKPGTGLIERAIAELNVNRSVSWFLGDTTVDVECARRAGLISGLIRTGHGGRDGRHEVRPDFEFFDLAEAVTYMLDAYPAALNLARRLSEGWKPGQVVALGGLARSGKSSFASVLARALRARGIGCVVVPLDGFLLSPGERPTEGPWRGFNVAGIAAAIAAVGKRAANAPATIPLREYDRVTGETRSRTVPLHVGIDDVVIMEGVPALALEAVRDVADCALYFEVDAEVRQRRFAREYAWRGRSEADVLRLYREREDSETPHVVASRVRANVVVNGDFWTGHSIPMPA